MNRIVMFKHWWMLFGIATCAGAAAIWVSLKGQVRADGGRTAKLKRFTLGFLFWGNLPWIVMGYGLTFGGVPGFWQYFRPHDGDPYVLSWFATGLMMWILGFYWLFFRDGTDFLSSVFWDSISDTKTTNSIKVLYILCGVSIIIGVLFMLILDFPLPK